MRRPLVPVAALLAILAGCTTPAQRQAYRSVFALVQVERSPASEAAEPILQTDTQHVYRFADRLFEGSASVRTEGWTQLAPDKVRFRIRNRSGSSARLVWDEATFISHRGSASRVIHAGTPYVNRNNPQAPSVIPNGAALDDIAVPADHIYVDAINNWQVHPLIPIEEKAPGQRIGLMLPIDVGGTRYEYTLWFETRDPSGVPQLSPSPNVGGVR